MPSKCTAEVLYTPIGKSVVKKLQIKTEKIQKVRKIQINYKLKGYKVIQSEKENVQSITYLQYHIIWSAFCTSNGQEILHEICSNVFPMIFFLDLTIKNLVHNNHK